MKPKKAIKELRKQLKGEPGNVVVTIRLASLLRDTGAFAEAVQLYLAVAQSYQATDRLGQAIAVCKGILEFAPNDPSAQQMLAYLEQSRLLAEMEDNQEPGSPPPSFAAATAYPVAQYPYPPAEELRRKRPTSYPTPLTDRGRGSILPGAPATPTKGTGRANRISDSALATGLKRNMRPTETIGHTLSPRSLEPDATVPGAPPTSEFKLRDLSSARAVTRHARPREPEEGITLPKIPKGDRPRLPLTASPSASRPPPPPPRGRSTGAHTVSRSRSQRSSYSPPDLAPAPTPLPGTMSPPPPLRDQSEADEDSHQPGLEDATIVDANFDMAKFILSQSQDEHDPNEEDLPDIPGQARAQEVTRFASPEPGGVSAEKLGALRRLPDYALKALAAGATETSYPGDYALLREGDRNDTCYILVEGQLQVLKRNALDASAPMREVSRLSAGALFGEYALVGDRRCLASLRCSLPSTMIEIPRSAIADLTTRFPGLRPTLELLYRDILIESLMRTSPVFSVLTEEEWPEVLGLFEPVRAAKGQRIIEAGQRFGGFYLVLTGEMSVQAGQGGNSIGGLGAGFYVGEVSMLKGENAQATVQAESTVELARLDSRRFYALVAGNPRLWAHIWQEIQSPELLALQLIAGFAANV